MSDWKFELEQCDEYKWQLIWVDGSHTGALSGDPKALTTLVESHARLQAVIEACDKPGDYGMIIGYHPVRNAIREVATGQRVKAPTPELPETLAGVVIAADENGKGFLWDGEYVGWGDMRTVLTIMPQSADGRSATVKYMDWKEAKAPSKARHP
jgi:hypothetical protein